jgi:iodotyrosine deiodinase
LNEICNRPENEKALMIVVVGHPKPDATIPKEAIRKKPLNAISSFL